MTVRQRDVVWFFSIVFLVVGGAGLLSGDPEEWEPTFLPVVLLATTVVGLVGVIALVLTRTSGEEHRAARVADVRAADPLPLDQAARAEYPRSGAAPGDTGPPRGRVTRREFRAVSILFVLIGTMMMSKAYPEWWEMSHGVEVDAVVADTSRSGKRQTEGVRFTTLDGRQVEARVREPGVQAVGDRIRVVCPAGDPVAAVGAGQSHGERFRVGVGVLGVSLLVLLYAWVFMRKDTVIGRKRVRVR